MPVVNSVAKFRDGDETEPSAIDRMIEPVVTVEALYRLTESHTKITCWPAGTTTDALPATPVLNAFLS